MLLSSRMASIPCSSRHSISNLNDLQTPVVSFESPSITPSLQYFNMRVTERLHRYRSLKRQWNGVATAIQNGPSPTPKSESPLPMPEIISLSREQTIEPKMYDAKDYFISTTIKSKNERNSTEVDPLHSRIQKDLIKLRNLIKIRQKKRGENVSSKTNTNNRPSGDIALISSAFDDQDNNSLRKLLSLNKSNSLNRVKISGCRMRPSTFPQTNLTQTRTGTTSDSSCSQYSKQQATKNKQQNINKIFEIYRTRVNPSLPSDALIQGVPPPKQKSNIIPKSTLNTSARQTQSYRLPVPPIINKKQASFIKQDTLLPLIRRPSITEQTTTCLYTFAASTSSATPHSMKLSRNTSLLPILLTSSSCMGIQPRKTHKENNDNSYSLHDYQHLINHLPKPIIPILPHYDQNDYGILFEQLDHIRENMPNANVYERYTRIC